MSTELIERLMDVVEAVEHPEPEENFASSSFALHALAISNLPPAERERTLQAIEDGSLRRAVARFPDSGARQTPEVPCGSLH
jgi:hypothetical protein